MYNTPYKMTELFEKFIQRLQCTSVDFVRSIMDDIQWEARLIGIRGARGVGKTTLLLQYIQLRLSDALPQTLYVSLDALWFANNSLASLIDEFARKGGRFLFLDEVHKYPNWSQEIKNAYDEHPQLHIVFTGSSALEILNARADLSRRAVVYDMQGFSFREYLSVETTQRFDVVSLGDLLRHHEEIARSITTTLRPLQYWDAYLRQGYYPFYREQPSLYSHRVGEVINMILEIELPQLRGIEVAYIHKLKQLLAIIAAAVPFSPNVSKLSEKMQINRTTLLSYLHYLDEIRLTNNLFRDADGISRLQKPMKIYLENPNLMYVLAPAQVNPGNLRETFFCNQVGFHHTVQYADRGDFVVDDTVFEVGGRGKGTRQIAGIAGAYTVSDDTEIGFRERIPLWLFGFLY